MTSDRVIRWWPPIGIFSMLLLGVLVGKGSTPVDEWFLDVRRAHRWLRGLLVFTDARFVVLLCTAVVLAALIRRRWRLAAVFVVTPGVALVAVRTLKPAFGREKIGELCYPSGHVTLTIVVASMAVILLGGAAWAVAAAVVIGVLGSLGQAFTVHYFTDTVGAALLATSLVCLAVRVARLDRCQADCDLDHSTS